MTQRLSSYENDLKRSSSLTLSRRLWGLDWGRLLPWQLTDDVRVVCGTFDDAVPFIRDHYQEDSFFGAPDGRFLAEPMTEAKRRFCAEMDVFLFMSGSRLVGLLVGHPSDWSTYYLRNAALLPAYRGRRIVQRCYAHLYTVLRGAGVARMEGDIPPTNAANLNLHLGEGFIVTSSGTSERWGALLHVTKFLGRDSEAVFQRQFSAMPASAGHKTNPERSAS